MKASKKFLAAALMLAVILMSSSYSFAAVTVASPAENAIIYSQSLLVSVKCTASETVRVSLNEEKDAKEITVFENGKAEKKTEYYSVNVKDYTKEDLALLAAGKTEDENGKPILLSTGEQLRLHTPCPIAEAETFSCKNAGIYAKTFEELKPGLYSVKVETLADDGTAASVISELFAVKEEQAEKEDVLPAKKPGVIQAIKDFVKSLFD